MTSAQSFCHTAVVFKVVPRIHGHCWGQCNLYTAKLYAVSQAFRHSKHRARRRSGICTDSMNFGPTTGNTDNGDSLLQQTQALCHVLQYKNFSVSFIRAPSHVKACQGNEETYSVTRIAADSHEVQRFQNFCHITNLNLVTANMENITHQTGSSRSEYRKWQHAGERTRRKHVVS